MKKYFIIILMLLMSISALGQIGGGGGGFGGGGGSSTITVPLAGTPLSDLQFSEGTGLVAGDSSGHSNTCTFVTTKEPVWVRNGLNFADNARACAMAAGVNGALTVEILAYTDPVPNVGGNPKSNNVPLYVSSSLASPGLNLLYSGGGIGGLYTLGSNSGGGNQTGSTENYAGLSVLTYVLGTGAGNTDHFYINGQEVTYTIGPGASGNRQTSGNVFLGSSALAPFGNSGFIGTFYRVRFLSDQLTAAQAATNAVALKTWAGIRGIQTIPAAPIWQTAQMVVVGDSLSCASANGSSCTPAYSWATQLTLTNQPTYTLRNISVYGSRMQVWATSEPWRGTQYCKTNQGPAVAFIFGGTNDAVNLTYQQFSQSMATTVAAYKVAGCRVFIMPILSHTGNSSVAGTPSYDSIKNLYDPMVAADWKSWGADGLVDLGSIPQLSADGASANLTYFLADGVHLQALGEGLIATAVSAKLNSFFSIYSLGSPHAVSTTPYTMTAADNALNFTTGAAVVNLISCVGLTDTTFSFTNTSGVAVTLTASGSEIINGTSTAVVANGTTVKLTASVLSYSTSGCRWTL